MKLKTHVLQKTSTVFNLTIPNRFVEDMGWEKGDSIMIFLHDEETTPYISLVKNDVTKLKNMITDTPD